MWVEAEMLQAWEPPVYRREERESSLEASTPWMRHARPAVVIHDDIRRVATSVAPRDDPTTA